jgi:hypothetical protein
MYLGICRYLGINEVSRNLRYLGVCRCLGVCEESRSL